MRKRTNLSKCSEKREVRRIGLYVKFSLMLWCIGIIPVSGKVGAQQQKMDIFLQNVSVEVLIKEIKQHSHIDFLYNLDEIEKGGKVSVRLKKATVGEILKEAFKGKPLDYSIVNNVVVIRPLDECRLPQQQEMIRGTVKDKDGKPLVGVSVLIKGINVGVTTDNSGRFEIIKPKTEPVTLIFSFIGMKTVVAIYKGQPSMDLVMEEELYELQEVNIGYQKLNPREVTSAISSVRAEDILVPGMTSIDQALEGRIPELLLMTNSGEVGATPRIRVRGTSSLIGKREPLWVLDGFILQDPVKVSNEDLNDPDYVNIIGNAIAGINPQDIERIDVLKDAAATALYGTRAANGVIVVTTKKGAIGQARVTYNHSSKLTRRPRYTDRTVNLMNSQERVSFGKSLTDIHYKFPDGMPMVGYEGALYRWQTGEIDFNGFQEEVKRYEAVNTDWFDILTQDTYSHDHTLSISGGTEDIRYYVSLGYNHENGVSKSTYNERYTTRTNLNIKFSDRFRMNVSFGGNISKKNNLADELKTMEYAYNTTRALPCYDEDGTLFYYGKVAYGGMNRSHNMFKYNILNESNNSTNSYDGNTMNASVDMKYNFRNVLDITVAGNYNRSNTLQEKWWGERSNYIARLRNAEYGDVPMKGEEGYCILPYGGLLRTTNTISENYTFRTQLDFRKYFGMEQQHLVTAMGGFEMNSSVSRSISDENRGYMKERGLQFVDNINLEDYPHYRDWINTNHRSIAYGITRQMSGYITLGYGYKNHFNLNVNARVDASNKFGDRSNERFLPIWAFSAGWNLKENVLRNFDFFSDVRLRGSVGLQGNMLDDQSPNLIIKQGTIDALYNENVAYIARYPNPNLRWEKTQSYNLGLDVGMFHSRLNISGSFYYKKTEDCFTTVNVSTVNGLSSYVMNGGNTENTGYSVSITGSPVRTHDWEWRLSTNYSGNINQVRSGSPETYTYTDYLAGNALVDGEAVSTFYSYKFIGLNPRNGAPLFDDYTDRRHLLEYKSLEDVIKKTMDKSGQRDPIFSGNVATTLRYKQFTFSANLSYSLGSKVRLLGLYESIGGGVSSEANVRKEFLNRWRVPGDEQITDIPALMSKSHPDYDYYVSHYSTQSESRDHIPTFATNVWDMYDKADIRVVNGNFLKCSSCSLRYSFDARHLRKTPFSNASVSVSALNLFTVSAKELKGQHPSQQGFAAIGMSVRPSYTFQFSVTF